VGGAGGWRPDQKKIEQKKGRVFSTGKSLIKNGKMLVIKGFYAGKEGSDDPRGP